ncbi:MAG: tandem-95 repeat protein [Deltaproteobacteria bacterium]|nr:tandem-95 repeat protein [Deltaproteobacteria bacterium]
MSADIKVTVVAINDTPAASAATASGAEDQPITGTVAGSDVDGDALTYRVGAQPKRGTLKLDEQSGAFAYTPWKDAHGSDAFTFAASDGKLFGTATVSLTVAPVDDPPALLGAAPVLRVLEDGKVDAAGGISYAPVRDYAGEDGFVVEATAGGASVSADIKVAVVAVNDAPVANAASASGAEDQQITGTVAGSDVDGDALSYRVSAQPKRGSLVLDERSGVFSYTPWKDTHGTDAFSFAVSDGKLFGTAACSLVVTPVDDPPLLLGPPPTLTVAEDSKGGLRLNAKDVDGDALTWRVASAPGHGEAAVDAKGAVSYVPAADYAGDDRFTVEVMAAGVAASSEARVTVTPVTDPPVADAAAVAETVEDTVYRGRLPAADPDGDPTTFSLTGKARLGQAVLDDAATGAWHYTPKPDQHGDDEVAFAVVARGQRVTGTARVRVSPQNDPATLSGVEVSTLEEQPVELKLSGADVDGDRLNYQLVAAPQHGEARVLDAAAGTMRVTPAKDFTGELTFDVVAKDASASSAPARVRVQVKPVNDAPRLERLGLKTSEDVSVKGKVPAIDVDGDKLTFKVGEPSSLGEIVLAAADDGSFTFNPRKNASGATVFTIVAADPSGAVGSSTVTVTVSAVDDPPVAVGARELASRFGRMNGRLSGYDPEGAPVRFRITSQPNIGQVELLDDKTGEYQFSTSGSGSGQTAFTFVVDDGGLVSVPARVDVLVR